MIGVSASDAGLGRMGAVPGRPKAWAHDAIAFVLTIAAVHTDGDRFRVIPAGDGNAGISIVDAVSVIGSPGLTRAHPGSLGLLFRVEPVFMVLT